MGSTPRTIQSLLHTAAPDLSGLVGRARFLARVRTALLAVLPQSAAPRIHVANYEAYRLTLHVADAAWATRLRYMEAEIGRALAQRMRLHVAELRVRVRPELAQTRAAPPRPRFISEAAKRHLERSAACAGNPELAAALRRLTAAGRSE